MSAVGDKIKNIGGEKGGRRRTVISACIMIVFAVVMFFLGMFAPFQYYSDKEVLHVVLIDEDRPEDAHVYINTNERVHQSLFKLFEAVGALADASRLHAASTGTITDYEKYEKARDRLSELRKQYSYIWNETYFEAKSKGISPESTTFIRMLADNLSEMNLMALDLLETAFTSDNTGAYETLYGAVTLALFSALLTLCIMILSVVAIALAVGRLVSKDFKDTSLIFYRLFAIFSAVGMVICIFNPMIPPAAGPLAAACLSVAVFYIMGILKGFADDAPLRAFVKNSLVGALVPVSMLCLSSMPSLIMYANGLGGRYLFYPGTVGTVCYSRVKAAIEIGLDIPYGAVTLSFILGGLTAVLSIVCAVKALEHLYKCREGTSVPLCIVMCVTAALSLALVIALYAVTAQLQAAGKLVRYIPGACWYVTSVIMVGCTVLLAVLGKKSGGDKTAAADAEQAEVEGGDGNAEVADKAEERGADGKDIKTESERGEEHA